MKVGAHVGASGGLINAFERAQAIGAEAIQIFGAPPQMWRRRKIREDECEAFRARAADTGIEPIFIHGVYLINLATANPELLTKSTIALAGDLQLASAIAEYKEEWVRTGHPGEGQVMLRIPIYISTAPQTLSTKKTHLTTR
ncbi:MAG: hypothetical protein IIB21_04535 [Chloroflexi bacterium]|nr:hypothetical protein [Chloroflexota bacterium]